MPAERWDLRYPLMPWDRADTVVFDIGNVLVTYLPEVFVRQLFPQDEDKQRRMLEHVYEGPYWAAFDRGAMTYDDAADRLVDAYGGCREDYLKAMTQWTEVMAPLEEGWRVANACKARGKRLILLSNYHSAAYARLRQRFEDRFRCFDGACISCDVHQNKPESAIYESLIGLYRLDPSRTLFIDDTLANVEGAIAAGIHGFHMDEAGKMDRFFGTKQAT